MMDIGLIGGVRITKDLDFERWGIVCNVNFREREQLTALKNYLQSGVVRHNQIGATDSR